jgi:BirA family biotin operon repressor/biotin-[acetyl-CoA-carboxylase] ligase
LETNILDNWQSELRLSLGSKPLWQVHCYESIGTTMDTAKEHIGQLTLNSPLIILAKEQTAGRGRHGSTWSQADIGLYATFAFASSVPPHALSGLSLMCGCSLHSALEAFGADLRLKWPNDLLSRDGKKLCGILIEISSNSNPSAVLIGVGVNISGVPAGVESVTSLEGLTGQAPSPVGLIQRIAPIIWENWQQFLAGGFESFRSNWLSKASGLGQEMIVESGGQKFEGVFTDVARDGALMLKDRSGKMHKLVSGHVISMVRGA